MRFKLYFTLEKPIVSIQYRKGILSFMKHALAEYDIKYFQKYYHEKDPIRKEFSFSIYFKNPKIQQNQIILEDNQMEMNLTTSNYEDGIVLYNAFNKQKYNPYPFLENKILLQKIAMIKEKEVKTDTIVVKFQSPLCVRSRENNKDYYYSFEDEKFEETLKINIKEQLKITNIPIEIVDTFEIIPIKAKKVMIKFYEKCLECSTGTFELKGQKELLTYLYQAGMGSRHSAGFGMFQII